MTATSDILDESIREWKVQLETITKSMYDMYIFGNPRTKKAQKGLYNTIVGLNLCLDYIDKKPSLRKAVRLIDLHSLMKMQKLMNDLLNDRFVLMSQSDNLKAAKIGRKYNNTYSEQVVAACQRKVQNVLRQISILFVAHAQF